jgi:Domain of unknown function (DUF4129)
MDSLASIKIVLFAAVLFGAGCFTDFRAATLDDYRARLSHALTTIQRLQMLNHQEPTAGEQSSATMIGQLKAELPVHEDVLLTGQTITVDNRWLHEALTDYGKTGSQSDQAAKLKAIGERLLAILERVDELKRSPAAAANADESKARLAEILRRPEYNKSAPQGSALTRLLEAFVRWLSSLFPQTKPLQPGSSRLLSRIGQIIVIAVSVGLIAFLAWKFAPRYFRNRGKKKKKREPRIILGERLEPDQSANDLLAQAEELAHAGDLRAAIRKAYIALLCELGDRRIISLAQHKTNRDYLTAVRQHRSLFETMRNLTNSFEVHWYGFVPAKDHDWNAFRHGYDQALRTGVER